MALTGEQLATLKAFILADEALSAIPMGSDGSVAIAAIINQVASPDWIIWRTNVTANEIMNNGFGWARVDNLSVGKARIWEWMTRLGSFNPSKANVRAGIDATWVGTQADLNVRAAVYTHCKKAATRAQKLFSTGTGSTESPATLAANISETFTLGYQEIDIARELP